MLRVSSHFSASDTGLQRRANEDSYFARAPVFVVADGMGGAQAGEVASRAAVELLAHGLPEGEAPAQERLASRAAEANARIHELSQQDASRAGMGTTLTAAYVGPEEVAIAHVGDSRAYCLRDGELLRLTSDHSLVEELVRQGKLTPEEAEEHPQRSIITRALGPEPHVEVDTFAHPARAGDLYLICSDGLTGMVPEEKLRSILLSTPDLSVSGRALIAAANAAGGRDNITVILFALEDAGGAGAGAATSQAQTRRRMPRLPDTAAPAPVRHRRSLPGAVRVLLALVVVLGVIATGAWVASQSVYFVGADRAGRIEVFRGVPYELPAGVALYSTNFVSGVTLAELSPAERSRLLNHKLRSHDDASDLLRRLERGQINQG